MLGALSVKRKMATSMPDSLTNYNITPAIKYITFVIPAKAGIQRKYWMPNQVRHG